MRLSKAVFRYIETELFSYDDTRKELLTEREDIISGAPVKAEGSRRGAKSDPTAAKAGRLLSSASISQMERSVRAIDKALARLSDDHRLLFELYYRKAMHWQQVSMQLPCSKTKFYDLRNEIVRMTAIHLGYEVDVPRKKCGKSAEK